VFDRGHRRRTIWAGAALAVIVVAGGITAAIAGTTAPRSVAGTQTPAASTADHAPLVTTIACNQAPCGAAYDRSVLVALSATDQQSTGPQVTHTYYTTNGSTPTTSSNLYTGPFTISKPTTVKFFSTDLTGRAGSQGTQYIQVETGAAASKGPGSAEQFKPGQTVVSLTFDDAYEDQWLYSAPLLQDHQMTGTYYVITIDPDESHTCCMSWAQLDTLQANGNDIGGQTVDHPNLKAMNRTEMEQEICGSRQDLIDNGITVARSFAYPYGLFNATAEGVARQCGYSSARVGGGLSNSNVTPTPPYTETIPPENPEALRTIAVDGAKPERLQDLESFVEAGAAHGGGWIPITFHNVCDAKASDYRACMGEYGSVVDTVFGQFLDWLQAAGQPGGAPKGVIVRNVCQVMNCS